MCSKPLFRIFAALLFSVLILSCNLKIGETPPVAKIPEYKADSCFSKATESFGEFFEGEAKDEELASGWDCFGSMIKDFKSKVRCKERDKCTPGEVAQFVEDNFLEEKPSEASQTVVSSELQLQFMKIKKLFLGGNLEYISPDELDRLAGLMGNLKGITRDINPSMKVLTLNWENKLKSSDVSLYDFEAVNLNLVKLAQQLSGLIDKKENVYHFDDFYSLVNEMGNFVGSRWSWIDTIKNYLPLIKKLKKSINGGDEESLKDNEWNLFLLLGSRGYIQFLRYYYFIKDLEPEFTSLRLAYTARTVEEVFQILYDLLSFKESNQVSKAELEDLLKSFSNIWPVVRTSPGFLNELMKLKQVFIGGSESGFGKDDFLRAQKKVNLTKQIVEKFLPYYQFYGLSWKPELLTQANAFSYFKEATQNFTSLISKLTDEFNFENGYSLQSLVNLMDETEKLYPSIKESSVRRSLIDYSCLIQLTTDIVLDKQNHVLKRTCDQVELTKIDISRLVKKSGEVFNVFLDYYYFISKSQSLANDLELQSKMKGFGYNAITFLRNTINERKSKRISSIELKAFVKEMINLSIVPSSIKQSTIESLIDTLLSKILVPDDIKGKLPRFDGMEVFHVDQIYRELDNFLGINIFIHQTFENKNVRRFDYASLLKVFKQSIADSTNPNFKLGMTEFVKNFETSAPLIITQENRIFFKKDSNPVYDKKTLEKYNLNRFLSGLLIRSYAKMGKKSVDSQLSDCDVKNAFNDLRPILVDFDIISETSGTGFIDARFIEANLFLTKSDGNSTVSFDELAEFANYIFSGFVIDASAKTQIISDCSTIQEGQSTLVDLSCLRSTYKKNLVNVLGSMPSYVSYSQVEGKKDWELAFLNNLKSAGYKPRADQKVSLSDASLFPHILQYGETLFLKFDDNNDGFIDKKEGLRAFPYFGFLLKKVAREQLEDGVIKENELEALFTYILKYGKIPDCDESFVLLCLFDRNVIKWFDWKTNYKKDDYTFKANRTQVSKILGIIADMVATSPSVQGETCPK